MKSRTPLLLTTFLVTCVSAPDRPRSAAPTSQAVKPFSPVVVAPGQGRATGYPGGHTSVLFQGQAGTDEISVIDVMVPPHSLGAPPHLHHHEDEYFYVAEGEITVLIGTEERTVSSGAYAALPRELRHGYWNGTNTPAHVLITIAPGRFAQFFLDVAEDLKKRGEIEPQRIGAIIAEHAKQYDCEVYLDQIAPIAEHYKLQ